MRLSFWEKESWFTSVDYVIVGSGIVGLNAALRIKALYPSSKVLVLEQGIIAHGASTRNAGFACFGSLTEIAADIASQGETLTLSLIKRRWEGLKLLRQTLGDESIGFSQNGGFELHREKEEYESLLPLIPWLNEELRSTIGENVYQTFEKKKNSFGFKGIAQVTGSLYEGQINTGAMMQALIRLAISKGILILNGVKVTSLNDNGNKVELELDNGLSFSSRKCLVTVNGFARELMNMPEVLPARAQVLITKPLKELHFKGCFHLDQGFYYFRNVGTRVLFGGGRNLDLKGEESTETITTPVIQEQLDRLLNDLILPGQNPEIEMRWAGIMGVGAKKKPIIKALSNNIFCGVRLGGMGVAIGSLIGKEVADLATE